MFEIQATLIIKIQRILIGIGHSKQVIYLNILKVTNYFFFLFTNYFFLRLLLIKSYEIIR